MKSQKSPAFQFYAKQWLGDDAVILMDWDVRGMHIHLMAISWQQNPQGTLPNDEEILKKFLSYPKDWDKRVKKQLLRAWEEKGERLVQKALLKEAKKQKEFRRLQSDKAKKRWGSHGIAAALPRQCQSNARAGTALQSSSSTTFKKEIKNKEKDGEPVPISQVLARMVAEGLGQ